MKRFGIAVTGALALLMVLSGSVFAAGPKTHAMPKTHDVASVAVSAIGGQAALDKDKDFGYYLWYDGSHFQLRTTDRGNGPGPASTRARSRHTAARAPRQRSPMSCR